MVWCKKSGVVGGGIIGLSGYSCGLCLLLVPPGEGKKMDIAAAATAAVDINAVYYI